MSGRSQDGHHAVPLAAAAARLGLSRDALRMRIRRGKAKGFKRGRQIYVWLREETPETPAAAPARPKVRAPAAPPAPRGRPLEVAEIQRQEIARLIRETDRLNARLDRHLDEARDLRLMLQREQILRQQEQSLRQDVQKLLDRLLAYPQVLGPRLAAARPGTAPPQAQTSPAPQAAPRGDELSLDEMLKEIGQSLRDLEARDLAAPGKPPLR